MTARAVERFNVGALVAVQLGVCGVFCLLVAAIAGDLEAPRGATVWSALIVTSLFASALGFLVQSYAQRYASPARTALILAAEPAFAGFFGYLLQDERLSAVAWVGALLILAAIVAGRRGAQAQASTAAAGGLGPGHAHEGLVSLFLRCERLKPGHPAVPELDDPGRVLVVQLRPARAAARVPAAGGDHEVSLLAELLPDRLEDLPVLEQVLDPASHALMAPIDASFEHGHDRDVFDVGRGDLEQGIDVSPGGRREPPLEERRVASVWHVGGDPKR